MEAAAAARVAYQEVTRLRRLRADTIRKLRKEMPRAEAAITSARSVREKEQAQHNELNVA
jgi:hypothetical protein